MITKEIAGTFSSSTTASRVLEKIDAYATANEVYPSLDELRCMGKEFFDDIGLTKTQSGYLYATWRNGPSPNLVLDTSAPALPSRLSSGSATQPSPP